MLRFIVQSADAGLPRWSNLSSDFDGQLLAGKRPLVCPRFELAGVCGGWPLRLPRSCSFRHRFIAGLGSPLLQGGFAPLDAPTMNNGDGVSTAREHRSHGQRKWTARLLFVWLLVLCAGVFLDT